MPPNQSSPFAQTAPTLPLEPTHGRMTDPVKGLAPPTTGLGVAGQSAPGFPPRILREEDLLGQVLESRYLVQDVIGKGTFGAVFRGKNVRTNGEVAIKVLVPSLVSNATGLASDNLLKRFELEAQVASQLTHPNTVRVYDYGRLDPIAYMVMQLLDGETLMDMIEQQGAMPPAVAIDYVSQVCGALAEAHKAGLIHRDLKPHNIMVVKGDDGDRVKVLDFGTVKASDKEWAGLKLTADGTVLGTAWYMSPEQARGDALDLRSDLYSLTVILFELLAGELPFDSPHAAKVMLAHVTRQAPRVDAVRPCLAAYPTLVSLVDRGLSKDRRERFGDAEEFRAALSEARAEVERAAA